LDLVFLQAKRYQSGNVVGVEKLQAFVGSLVGRGATKGVFVTTSHFSQQARDYVRHTPQRVVLIDGDRLTDLMVRFNVGVRVAQTVELKRFDQTYFSPDDV
jgi:restriction system protein